MKVFAVIMAGGIGSRFWPRSKEKMPKQLLNIFGDKTMIQETADRLDGLVEKENVFVITNKNQRDAIIKQLPDIPEDNIIAEPFGRNTAACIGLASVLIETKAKDAVMIVLPADHRIEEKDKFHDTIISAVDFAYKSKGLVTIGIPPTRPETGYGYIQINERPIEDSIFRVQTFAEKPNFDTAVRFVESGDFFWNSGMFIWRVDTIIDEFKIYMPDLYDGLSTLRKSLNANGFSETLNNVYGQLKKVSIDYGIMEKSNKVFLIKGKFSWSDVGSWEEVYQLSDKDADKNAKVGNVYSDMVTGSYIYSPNKFAALIGVKDLIIINTDDALLVCNRKNSQDVKKVVDYLTLNKITEHI